jgi:hypothetical protein
MIRFIGQSPNDGAVFSPLEDFDIIWTVKNIGKRDWNQEFYVRYSSGVEGKSKLYYLTRGVDVGDTIDIRVDMLAPFPPGNYRTTWQLINDDGVVIGTLFLAFSVK